MNNLIISLFNNTSKFKFVVNCVPTKNSIQIIWICHVLWLMYTGIDIISNLCLRMKNFHSCLSFVFYINVLIIGFLFFFFFQIGSLWDFIRIEFKRGYSLENDEKEFSDRREKVYTFMKIPLEVERFMFYGFCQVYAQFYIILDFFVFNHNTKFFTQYFVLILVRRFIPFCLYIPPATGISRTKIINLSFFVQIQVSILTEYVHKYLFKI